MAEKINTTELRNRIDNAFIAVEQQVRHETDVSVIKTAVSLAFDAMGYSYLLDSYGDFSITAAPGAYIHGSRTARMYEYELKLELNHMGLTSVGFYRMTVPIFGLEACKSLFDKLIGASQAEYDRLDDIVKGQKSSKLLKTVASQILRRYKLTGTTIESCDGNSELFWLSKKIFKNVSLRTLISFDSYDEGCMSLAQAYNCFPECLRDCNRLFFRVGSSYIPNYANGITYTGENTGELSAEHKMAYSAPLGLTPEDDLQSELSTVLNRLGYDYYVDGNTYCIYITDDMIIKRKGNLFWFKQISKDKVYESVTMADGDFNSLIQLIAWASPYERSFEFNTLGYFLIPLIRTCLSDKVTFYYAADHFTFIYGNEYYTIYEKQNDFVNTMYTLIKVFNSHSGTGMEAWMSGLAERYSDVELVIKKKYDFWD